MRINAVFAFCTLYISLTQRSKEKGTIETVFNFSRRNGDTKMYPSPRWGESDSERFTRVFRVTILGKNCGPGPWE